MTARVIIAIISVCTMALGGLVGNISAMLMDDELDRRMPGRARDSFMHWKGWQGFSDYRHFCPDGKLHVYALGGFGVALVGMIVFVILGVFSFSFTPPAIE